MKEYDLRGKNGCSDNPISQLTKLLNAGEEFVVIIEKRILPRQLADLFARKYNYELIVLSDEDENHRLLFKKKTSTI